jgi:hypothetical protein
MPLSCSQILSASHLKIFASGEALHGQVKAQRAVSLQERAAACTEEKESMLEVYTAHWYLGHHVPLWVRVLRRAPVHLKLLTAPRSSEIASLSI